MQVKGKLSPEIAFHGLRSRPKISSLTLVETPRTQKDVGDRSTGRECHLKEKKLVRIS